MKTLERNSQLIAVVLTAALCSSIVFGSAHAVTRTTALSSHFTQFRPVILKVQDGKQYKIDIDILQDAGQTTGEPYTYVNHLARDASVKLIRGEQFTVAYSNPYGPIDSVRVSLLDGRVKVQEGLNGNIIMQGKQVVLLQDYTPSGNSQAQLPKDLTRGSYNFITMLTYNEELRGYYITNAIVR